MLAYLKEASGSHAFGFSLQLWEEDCEFEMQQPLYSLTSFFFLFTSIFSPIPPNPLQRSPFRWILLIHRIETEKAQYLQQLTKELE
jgi:hypothetical protein